MIIHSSFEFETMEFGCTIVIRCSVGLHTWDQNILRVLYNYSITKLKNVQFMINNISQKKLYDKSTVSINSYSCSGIQKSGGRGVSIARVVAYIFFAKV
jgi:hypothetical protein